jgi:hypothetical protein
MTITETRNSLLWCFVECEQLSEVSKLSGTLGTLVKENEWLSEISEMLKFHGVGD